MRIALKDHAATQLPMRKLSLALALLAGCTGGPRYLGIDAAPAPDGKTLALDGSSLTPDAVDAGSTPDGARIIDAPIVDAPIIDAPPACTWGAPTILLNVNSHSIEGLADVSDDGLTLYFSRVIAEADTDIYVATRPATTLPFGVPTRLSEVDEGNMFDQNSTISKTGTELFYRKADPDSSTASIWTASRGSPAAKFGNAHSIGVDGFSPSITGDGLELYYVAINAPTVRKVTRSSIGGPWSAPSDVMPSMGYGGIDISSDGLKMVFSEGPVHFLLPPVQIAERTTTTAAFGPLVPIPSLNVAGDASVDKAASFNADATQIYLNMILPTGNGGQDIYVASCQ